MKKRVLAILLLLILIGSCGYLYFSINIKKPYLRQSEVIEEPEKTIHGEKNSYKKLSVPTCFIKVKDDYFISDCYHNQIIYSDSLEKPLKKWKVMDDSLSYAHTIASDGSVYLVDNTDENQVLVYEKVGEQFQKTQQFSEIGIRPHFIVYHEPTNRFYALSSMTGEIYVFYRLENSNEVVLEKILSIEKLENSYVRSFTIIGEEIYFVSGNSSIIKARFSDLKILEEYPVGEELCGMVQLEKIQDWYYITISTDASGNQDAATIIRTRDLSNLISGDYEDLYSYFGDGGGTPYYMGNIDGQWYLTEHRKKKRGIWAFDVVDNELKNIQVLY